MHVPKNLNKFKLGTVVKMSNTFDDEVHYGHIVGFSTSCNDELLIQVKKTAPYVLGHNNLQGDIVNIHPSNMEIL